MLALSACGSPDIDPSVAEGPIPRPGDPVDAELAAAGETLFQQNCAACHDWVEPLVGPPLEGVTERRSPEWIRSMVLSPDSMLATDSVVQTLHGDYPVPMPNLQIGEVQFRAIWEYIRSH
jgi:mono/diheme cytochrome c family protein